MEEIKEVQQSINTHQSCFGTITSWYKEKSIYTFETDQATLRLYVISSKIIRVRVAVDGVFEEDFSYSIDNKYNFQSITADFEEDNDCFKIITDDIVCIIPKVGVQLRFEDKNNFILCEYERGLHWENYQSFGGYINYCSIKVDKDSFFYGMGDKAFELNLRGARITNWNSDTYGFEKENDPLYKTIPFFYNLSQGRAYGIFIDNTFRSNFDFCHYDPSIMSFWVDGGEMNYYFIAGPSLIDISSQYNLLTGRPELPPMWALGYQQCKWSYYPDFKVLEIAERFRSKQIPCDVIYLDIDYMDGFRCFTWNNEYFPNPKKLISKLNFMGFKVVVIIDPGIKIDKNYHVYQQGIEGDHFCRRADGPLLKGFVWPGECHFPDFTSAKTRDWWADLFEDLMKTGVRGIWNDMNEPVLFGTPTTFPDDVRHNHDNQPCSHRKVHNIYGMQMSRASFNGSKKHLNGKRPFGLSRAGFAGIQRYVALWTGDNISNWEHLWMAALQIQRLNISGVSFSGSDIGGFIGEPDGELFVRWIQLATFHPLMRAHSSGDKGDKEPWVYGEEYTKIIKKFIELRSQLIPYLYSTFWQHTIKGVPMIRPLSFIDQHDGETYFRNEEFMLGDSLFLCPVTKKGALKRRMYFPKGKWYSFWDSKVYLGPNEIEVDCPLDSCPLFVKEGSVVPLQPIMQYVDEFVYDQMILNVYFSNQNTTSLLYLDKGEYYDHENGMYSVNKFEVIGNSKRINVNQFIEGTFNSTFQNYKIIFHGLPFKPKKCIVDGQEFSFEKVKKNYSLVIGKNFSNIELSI